MKYLFYLMITVSLLFLGSCNTPSKQPPVVHDTIIIHDTINLAGLNVDSAEIMSLKDLKSRGLYSSHCKFCHGNKGKGDGIKARIDTALCPHDLTKIDKPDQYVYYVILKGDKHMPPGEIYLNDEQVWMLVVHIKKFK